MKRTYNNGTEVRVGDIVVITKGTHEGKRAEVIEVGGCVYVSVQARQNSTYCIEVEIHESWLEVPENTYYVGGNIDGKRVFAKVANYNEARYVATNMEATHSRVSINVKKPNKMLTILERHDNLELYKFKSYGTYL